MAINAIEDESRGQDELDQRDADFQDGMRSDDDKSEPEEPDNRERSLGLSLIDIDESGEAEKNLIRAQKKELERNRQRELEAVSHCTQPPFIFT